MRQALLFAAGIMLATVPIASAGGARASVPEHPQGSPAVVVVLRDLSSSSQQVRFEAVRAVALRADGSTVELDVTPRRPAGGEDPEESLWIEGSPPAGDYSGIEVSFRSAAPPAPDRERAPELPPKPTRVEVPFVVGTSASTVLAVTLRTSVAEGSAGRVEPALEGRVRPRPTPALLGLASVGAWNGVALFDKRSGGLASVVPVGRGPEGLAIDGERLRAYVAVSGEDLVAVLDLLEGRVREQVPLRAGDAPRDVALAPDGRTLVVANSGSDTVSFVDPLSAIEIERVAVAGRPTSLLMDRDGRRVFVLAERSSVIAVLSVASRSAVGAIAVDSGPVRARLSGRNGERILVAQAGSPYLSVVDAATLAVTRRVYVGVGARALEVDPRSGRIFLARRKTGRIEVFDPASFLPLEEIAVPGEVAWLAVETEGNGLGVLLRDPAEARIVGLVGSGTAVRTPLGGGPTALRFVQGGNAP
jgi:YVTN family beta-propeller protein